MIKISRCLKFLILIFILVMMPILSYATSVSDGSNFISKSEFSSTINNLSNRVSKIEGSLDAKIDSLVSAYLAKNGIWNGEKQTINKNTLQFGNSYDYFIATMGYGAGVLWKDSTWIGDSDKAAAEAAVYYNSFAQRQKDSGGRNNTNVYEIVPFGGNTYYKVIDKFTKTGLLCINFREVFASGAPYEDSATSRKWRHPDDINGRKDWWGTDWSYGISWPCGFTFYEYSKNTVINNGALSSGSAVGNSLYIYQDTQTNFQLQSSDSGAKARPRDAYGSWYAFVTKENCLVCLSATGQNPYFRFGLSNIATGWNENRGQSMMYCIYSAFIY